MKFRGLALFAAALMLGAAVAWMIPWGKKKGTGDQPTHEQTSAKVSSPSVTPAKPEGAAPSAPGKVTAPTPAPAVPPAKTEPEISATPPVTSPIPEMRAVAAVPVPDSTGGKPVTINQPVDDTDAVALQLDKVGLMLRDYRTLMGDNPIGTNSEIMKSVMGGNPRQARLGPPEGGQLNAQGELVDRWGTPYFFHQLSATSMEIRSAGPDRVLWTFDDIIQH